jgi:YbbR domain-containing protein
MKLHMPRIIRHDLLRKLVALFFALVIWLTVSAQLSQTMVLHNVPVSLEYDPTEIVVESDVPTVTVTVRGSPRSLDMLKSSDVRLAATIQDVTPGMYFCDISISRRNVTHTPPGIRVVDIDQRKIQVRLDCIVTRKDVPVTVRFEGKIREGYRRTRCNVVPKTVDIRGPHRLVKDIQEVVTEPVLLDDTVVRDFEVDVALARVPGVQMAKTVHVAVQVARTSGQKNYAGLPMAVLIAPDAQLAVQGELPRISVTVRGPQTALDKLTPQQIHAFVDLSAVETPGQRANTVQVWIDGDEELNVDYVHPATIPLTLVAAPATAKTPSAPKTPAPDEKGPPKPAPTPNAPK